MKIKSELLFKKDTVEMVGAPIVGEANKNLQELAKALSGKIGAKKIAEAVLVIMLTDILKPLTCFPVAMYPSACSNDEVILRWLKL